MPPWVLGLVAIAVIAALVLPRLAEASAAAAKLLGPIGRYWRRRGQQRRIVAEITPADYQEMGRRVTNLDGRVRALESSNKVLERVNEVQQAYIVYDAQWHFEDELSAVGKPDCKPAARLTFNRFEDLYSDGWRPGS